ncbi:MAG: hypothetical protein ACYS8L_05715 [Planctomycetota bacterium]
MGTSRRAARACALLTLLVLASASTGCTYFKHRAQDFLEMADIGLTFTRQPTLGLYLGGVSMVCVGYSRVNGSFLGIGGGQIGLMRHSHKCSGLLLSGKEDMAWGDGPPRRRYVHPQGLFGVLGARRLPPPSYFPACVHFIHNGTIGVVLNLRYAEMLDFLIGFTTLDIAHDDGRKMGKWFWQ